MPKVETEFSWEVGKNKLIAGEKLKAGDEILVVLEGVHIRDNKEWGSAEINVSLQVATKSGVKDMTLGTFTGIQDDDNLISNPIVLLPSTMIEDYLNIAVNAIELDRAEGLFAKIPQIMEYIKKLSENVPIPGIPAAVNTASEVVASIINIAGLINSDDSILHNTASFVIDEEKFPGLHDELYLREGTLSLNEKKKVTNPTSVRINVIKKM